MKKVNIFPGRFQPFHKGHLKCCEDAYKKNGYPCVIMYIHNEKFDERKPFGDEFIEEELEMLKKSCDYIEDAIWIRRPLPMILCRLLHERDYEPVLWLAGEDRIDSYKRLMQPEKIKDEFGFDAPEFMITNRYCSATEVRQSIANDDYDTYKDLMPEGVNTNRSFFDKLKKQLDKVLSKTESRFTSLKSYIIERLK